MNLVNGRGKPVVLGAAVGHGGEATVYQVVGQPGSLAKVYEPGPRANYPQKLAWMVEHPPENPTAELQHPSLAWPDFLLYDRKRDLKGYCMPWIAHAAPLLDVFNPRRRALVMPQFDRRYLHRTARNLAAAYSALHRTGYVAGDVNESNVLVTPAALVTLIDTDSFQVCEKRSTADVIHPCPVGKPEYTPPELQGINLGEARREPDHDAFGLAVLIFQLLMNGNHPFRAQWLGEGDPPPIEQRIAQGAFPYASDLAQPVAPPLNSPGLDSLHPWLAELFRRCFIDGHRSPRWRPGPDLWARAIDAAEASLVCCAEGHFYASHLLTCPYCALKQKQAAAAHAGKVPNPAAKGNRPVRPPQRAATPAPTPRRQPAWGRPARPQAAPAPAATAASTATNAAANAAANAGAGTVSNAAASGAPAQAGQPGGAAAPRPATRPVSASGAKWFPGGLNFSFSGWPGSAAPAGAAAGLGGSLGSSPGVGPAGVLRSRPPVPAMPFGAWLRQWISSSILVGGGQGAAAGLLPGALVAFFCWSVGSPLNWSLLLTTSGAAGGLLRGWRPGYRLAALVDQYLGWKNFWQGVGLAMGAAMGSMLGLLMGWAVIPVILGLVLGGRLGMAMGKKFWQLGSSLGWERIWGAVSALGAAGLGWGAARLAGAAGLNTLGAELAVGLMPFGAEQSITAALLWMIAGGASGALFGAVSGMLVDLIGRFTRLTR